MRRYYLRSFGCQMNDHDAERLMRLLDDQGLVAVQRPDEADVLVYNTCTVRQSADERLAGHLGEAARLKRERPDRVVLVTGCLPQAEQDAVFRVFPCVDGILGPQNVHRLADLLRAVDEGAVRCGGARLPAAERPAYVDDSPHMSGDLPAWRARPFQAWVQVMSGCTNRCSYCIVPRVRGPERSRPADDILAEIRRLGDDGVREVTLLGQNVNAYGRDASRPGTPPGGTTFAHLLRRIDALGAVTRVRFLTSHPKDLSDDLVEAVAGLASVCEHVHLPLQSGADRVLATMNRGYTAEAFLQRVSALRAAVPDVCITTDLIAGFPGESEGEFRATLEVVEQAAFDAAFTFVFSPRPGTPAAALPHQVPADVARERVDQLIALTQRLALRSRSDWVGRTTEVLVEGPSRHTGSLRGRTRQNVTVNFTGAAEPGAIVAVQITGATSTTLRGRR